MRRRVIIQALLSIGGLIAFMILTAPKVYADNCGSLNDCFQVSGAAASVTTGVAVIITIAVLALPSLLGTSQSTPTPLGSDPTSPGQPPLPPLEDALALLGTSKRSPTPLESDPTSPEQPPLPPLEGAPESQAQMYQQHPVPDRPPEHMQPHATPPPHMQPHSTPPPPHQQAVHQSQDASVPDRYPEHMQPHATPPPHTQPHITRPPHMQPHATPPSHQQSQELRSDQQAQITRPDEQIQIARPDEPASLPRTPLIQPPVRSLLYGLHHVTAIAGNPQQNIDFYTGLLGLRLVKLTVNIDNPNTYHLYYGDELGRPGTVLSFFAWPGVSGGSRGSGQPVAVAFSVPEGALNYWGERLSLQGINIVQSPTRFDEHMFSFYDPDGLQIDMVAHRDTGMYPAQSSGPIPPAYAIRGIYGVTLLEANYEPTHAFLTDALGFRQVKAEGNRIRYEAGGGPGTFLDVVNVPGIPPGQAALGTIHHLAWRAPENEQQAVLQQRLTSLGINPTQGIDPLYFPSYSFREPGGALFEVAELVPGFTIDEPPEQLGTHLILPPWLVHRHAELQQFLPPLRLPFTGR